MLLKLLNITDQLINLITSVAKPKLIFLSLQKSLLYMLITGHYK